ncbi:tRNA 2-selenouridine(34) synthase MnmH [Photobacterium aphoticum]|uniref:tRNA 2-selenouridine synthase n=1 Tax=Photobacterium aphoticum TaxID=754436 RepID=A0A0J1JCN5_9GAMM|nr:tRNA 2-selenouridine(34) synthase MnmH [Photobacterium aphoticum]KLU99426.1 tRNA 2-selenouridine synthase [Photobacterium aphoticum]PSU55933.1 tRNA 2-selenouridine(34) synthase MnmH [Photobacterium aphoticum]GHA38269.1 tRNA 2-selenouridine synthase [Photobacterium aphoticum]
MSRPNCEDFKQLFLNDTPLMDMRAPVEFEQGAFPTSHNRPLMTDCERKAVGTCYKEQGQDAAIALGHQLVNGDVKAERVAQWKAFCEANPNGYLYCFRGGLRSRITQQWLKEAGIDFPMVVGGYKALRRFLIDTIDAVAAQPMTLIGGNTGCGKTLMLHELANGIDLEGAANHRGSSFGRYVTAQRTQIAFENVLAVEMLKKQEAGAKHFVFEDEGKVIGSVSTPLSIHQAMQAAPIAIVDDPMEVRLARLTDDYVIRMQRDFCETYGEEEGWQLFTEYLARGMFSIRKRLGLERYEELLATQQAAVQTMQATGSLDGHEAWLKPLLEQYYDPMYTYQLSKKADRIVFRGDYATVREWLAAR